MELVTTGPNNRSKPHFVYECWTDTQCLYVGMTVAPGPRLGRHCAKLWWPEVRRVEMSWYPDKDQARDREQELIERLQPRENWQHTERAEGSRSGVPSGKGRASKQTA